MSVNNIKPPSVADIASMWQASGLKDKIIFTLLMVVAFRFGAQIPIYGINNTIQYNTNGTDPERSMSEDELPDWLKSYLSSTYIRTFDLLWLDAIDKESKNGIGTSNSSSNSVNGLGNDPNGKSAISKENRLNTTNDINGINLNPSQSNARHGDLNSSKYTYGQSGTSIASASASPGLGNGLKDVSKKAYYIEKEIKDIKDISDNRMIYIILTMIGLLLIGYYYKKYTEEG